MKRLDQRVQHPWLVVSVILAVLYVAASAWSIHDAGWISPALVPILLLPFIAIGRLARAAATVVPQALDGDARRFRARERREEQRRQVVRSAVAGQLSIAPANGGALSDCDPQDRDRDLFRRG